MKTTFLESPDDLQWLADVHKVPVSGIACAILYGNEDCPDKVETYQKNDHRCAPVTWTRDPESDRLGIRLSDGTYSEMSFPANP